jgi:predicted RNA-binding Zn-ribbon protein involved in translation (DUF1610 family)
MTHACPKCDVVLTQVVDEDKHGTIFECLYCGRRVVERRLSDAPL